MAVSDRWHYSKPGAATKAGVTTPCSCRGTLLPTKDHGQKPEQRWQVILKGYSHRPGFPTKTEAKAWEEQQKDLQRQGFAEFNPNRGNIRFVDYAYKVVDARYKHRKNRSWKSQRDRVRLYMKPYFGDMTMRDTDITTSVAAGWLDWLRQKPKLRGDGPISENTAELAWTLFYTILKTAVQIDKLRLTHPCHGIKRPVRQRSPITYVWEREVVDTILAEIDPYYHVVARMAAACGLRSGEAFAMSVQSIRPLENIYLVDHQIQRNDDTGELEMREPKFGRIRRVPLAPFVAKELARHINKYGTTKAKCLCCKGRTWDLLVAPGGEFVRRSSFDRDIWGAVLPKVGITAGEHSGIHQLRHFYVSTLIAKGADVGMVQEACGHQSHQTTMGTYQHLFKDSKSRMAQMIEEAMGPGLRLVPNENEHEKEADHG